MNSAAHSRRMGDIGGAVNGGPRVDDILVRRAWARWCGRVVQEREVHRRGPMEVYMFCSGRSRMPASIENFIKASCLSVL
jgi:hypothetical protein